MDYWTHSDRLRGALTKRLHDLWRMVGHRLMRDVERTAWPLLTRTTAWTRQPVPLPQTSYLDRAAPDEHPITPLPLYGAAAAFAPGGSPYRRTPTRKRFPLVMMTGLFDAYCDTDCLNIRAEPKTAQAFIGLRLTAAASAPW